jgi:tetratricopeptide (TPR) repeat protein
MQKNILLFGGVALVIIILVGAALYAKPLLSKLTPQAPDTEATSTPNYKIEVDYAAQIKEIEPDLAHQVVYGASVPANVRTIIDGKIADEKKILTDDPLKADDWFQLGVLYHSANDYAAARDVWLFLTKVIAAPDSAVAYDNLGRLYKFDLKDFPKSEAMFQASIKANPNSITPYIELAELYQYLYKTDTTAAIDILKQAGAKFPDNPDPYSTLAQYYRNKADYADARVAYKEAIKRANAAGNDQLVLALTAEMNAMPQ